jgi:succinate-semialdehyde dehydrogenase/glutarate-semialdehyde dehydrogenase
VDAAEPARLESVSPATGAVLGSVLVTPPKAVAAAVEGAAGAQRLWRSLRVADRARYMQRAAQAVIDEADELTDLVCAEQGRPRVEAELMELVPAIETLQWLAGHGPKILSGERISFARALHPVKRGRWTYEPLGVIGVLGPAAEPFATPLGDIAVALMAGNGVVFKPSPYACLAGERIARVFTRAGLPEGLLRVVHGHTDTGSALASARVAQVRFTGSANAGRAVGETLARGVKRAVLEMGGKDVAVVCADADLERAARGVVWAAFANAGQCGGSVERAVVVRDVHDAFLAAVCAGAASLTVGDPSDPRTEIGPIVSRARANKVRELVEEAVADGATIHCGGDGDGPYVAPVVLTGVRDDMRIAREDVPGPVLTVSEAATEDGAIAQANRISLGLGASVWTADRYKAQRIAAELRVGMVWVNDHLVTRAAPEVPWGGVRGAGIGRARGAIALRTCAEPKVVTWDPPVGRPWWWFPYDAGLAKAGRTVARMRSARDADRVAGLRDGALPTLRVAARALRRGSRSA